MSRLHEVQSALERIASRSLWQALLLAVGMGLALTLVGCGSGNSRPASAVVKGTVTHLGQPVTEGRVNLYSAETGNAGAAILTSEGKYEISEGIPPGKYKAYVTPPPIMTAPKPGETMPALKEYPNIPDIYRSDSTSNLIVDVKPGMNEDVHLTID